MAKPKEQCAVAERLDHLLRTGLGISYPKMLALFGDCHYQLLDQILTVPDALEVCVSEVVPDPRGVVSREEWRTNALEAIGHEKTCACEDW